MRRTGEASNIKINMSGVFKILTNFVDNYEIRRMRSRLVVWNNTSERVAENCSEFVVFSLYILKAINLPIARRLLRHMDSGKNLSQSLSAVCESKLTSIEKDIMSRAIPFILSNNEFVLEGLIRLWLVYENSFKRISDPTVSQSDACSFSGQADKNQYWERLREEVSCFCTDTFKRNRRHGGSGSILGKSWIDC